MWKNALELFCKGKHQCIGTTLRVMRKLSMAKKEKTFTRTSFLLLIFLIISLISFYGVTLIAANCYDCQNQKWFLTLQESSVVFLFFNSSVNPFLTTFRINELKQSVKIVFWGRNQDNNYKTFGESSAERFFSTQHMAANIYSRKRKLRVAN